MYRKNKKVKQSFWRSKKLLIIIAVLLVAAVLAWFFVMQNSQDNATGTSDDVTGEETINYDPPTEEEKQATEEHKKNIGSDPGSEEPSSPSSKKTVTPEITSWGKEGNKFEVSAFVSGVIEDGGTCSLTLTQGSKTVTGSAKGMADAKVTVCVVSVDSNKIGSGKWTGVISYSSAKAQGTSEKVSDIGI